MIIWRKILLHYWLKKILVVKSNYYFKICSCFTKTEHGKYLESVVEVAFTATSGQNLSLDDVLLAGERLGDGLGILGVGSDPEFLDCDLVVLEKTLGLVFQKIQVSPGHLDVGGLWGSEKEFWSEGTHDGDDDGRSEVSRSFLVFSGRTPSQVRWKEGELLIMDEKTLDSFKTKVKVFERGGWFRRHLWLKNQNKTTKTRQQKFN